jgi:trigger factor
MKTEFVDVNETRKNVRVEIPSDVVNAEIDRIARDYSKKARIPGFRPGKAPASVIKQRYRDQILHDVAHDLIPRAVDDALREQGVEPVDTPDVRDVNIEEGRPLTFTASFDTLPRFDPGDLSTIALQRTRVAIDEAAVDGSLQRLRERGARFEPVEGRSVDHGDTAVLDIERVDAGGERQAHRDVGVELGGKANPPGLDQHLLGMAIGETRSFTITYPPDYPIGEMANRNVSYTVTLKGVKRRVLPELDDEFAKDLGEYDTLEALRRRVREDLEHEARHAAERELHADLLKQLAARVPFEVPASLVEREVERRLEEFVRRLVEQDIDPRQAGIDWEDFRERQRDAAREAVAATVALDAIARREQLTVTEHEIDQEIGRHAERSGRSAAAVRAALDKDGGLARVAAGLRRAKSIDLALSRATIAGES